VVTLGPGRAYGNAHQPNEYVPIQDLKDAVVFYKNFLIKTCL
jgi:acetylornithine deacetylase/succinyl-diaminopimelate desuccinylase-like protein